MTLEKNIALLIDGPNMANADITLINGIAKKHGDILIKEAYLTKFSSESLIEFYINIGYIPIIQTLKDVDTSIVTRATEIACSPIYDYIDIIAIASRDGDYVPLIHKVNAYQKKSLIIGTSGNGMSQALQNSAMLFEEVKYRNGFSNITQMIK